MANADHLGSSQTNNNEMGAIHNNGHLHFQEIMIPCSATPLVYHHRLYTLKSIQRTYCRIESCIKTFIQHGLQCWGLHHHKQIRRALFFIVINTNNSGLKIKSSNLPFRLSSF